MHSFTFRGSARKPKESIEAHSENCVIAVMNFKPLFSRAKLCPVIWMDSDHPLSFPRCSLDSDISEIQAGPSRLHVCLFVFFYPGYQQFCETENAARSESPSSVSRKSNCVKTEIKRGK